MLEVIIAGVFFFLLMLWKRRGRCARSMNDGFHVCHGAIAYFYRVSVKYFVEFTGC